MCKVYKPLNNLQFNASKIKKDLCISKDNEVKEHTEKDNVIKIENWIIEVHSLSEQKRNGVRGRERDRDSVIIRNVLFA